jgi:hypothetical protein
METKIYIDRNRAIAETKKAVMYGLVGLLFIFVVYYFTASFGHVAVPFIAGAVIIIALITIYRNIVLLFLPCIILKDTHLIYFNAVWYNRYEWNKIARVKYMPGDKIAQIENKQGRILNKLDLGIISDSDIAIVLSRLRQTSSFIELKPTEGTNDN